MKNKIVKSFLIIFILHFIIFPDNFFTKRKSFEIGGSFYFTVNKESDYGISEQYYKPDFTIFLFNYLFLSPHFAFCSGEGNKVINISSVNADLTKIFSKTDSLFDYTSYDIGLNIGFAYGKNFFLIPYFETGLIYTFNNTIIDVTSTVHAIFQDGTEYLQEDEYGPITHTFNFFSIPVEIGVKYPFLKYFSLTASILHDFYLNDIPMYYDTNEYSKHIKVKIMFSGLFY